MMKAITLVFTVVFVFSVFLMPTSYAYDQFSLKIQNKPVILQIGDDQAIRHTIDSIVTSIPTELQVISIGSIEELKSCVKNTVGYIIYVGHGQPGGLRVGKTLVTWTDVGHIIDSSPSQNHLFASCYSRQVKVTDKNVYGFSKEVDVDQAAMFATMMYFGVTNQRDRSKQPLYIIPRYSLTRQFILKVPIGQL